MSLDAEQSRDVTFTAGGREFRVGKLSMRDLAELAARNKASPDMSILEAIDWMRTPEGSIVALTLAVSKVDPVFTEAEAGEWDVDETFHAISKLRQKTAGVLFQELAKNPQASANPTGSPTPPSSDVTATSQTRGV